MCYQHNSGFVVCNRISNPLKSLLWRGIGRILRNYSANKPLKIIKILYEHILYEHRDYRYGAYRARKDTHRQTQKDESRAPVQIEYMITAIDKIRSEIGDEVISDALIALASACKVDFSNYQSCKIFKG